MTTITETHLSSARLSRRGKVRELYDLGQSLLLVASDRISAFDVVLSPGIPDKGKILTQLSTYWFRKFSDVENHLLETDVARFPEELRADEPLLAGRAVLVRKCEVIPFECVARGYPVVASEANFLWFDVASTAVDLAFHGERNGVVTRSFADTGLRITIGTPEENEVALAVLASAREHGLL